MRFKESMIAWNPRGEVLVVAWPDKARRAEHLRYTVGACFSATDKLSPDEVVAQVFIDFHTLVVRDGIDPLKAHAEFMKIDEYRERISEDIP